MENAVQFALLIENVPEFLLNPVWQKRIREGQRRDAGDNIPYDAEILYLTTKLQGTRP